MTEDIWLLCSQRSRNYVASLVSYHTIRFSRIRDMEQDPHVSKSQRKREMHALQALGKTLVELPQQQLAGLELPEMLKDAIVDARGISQRGALRRQLQYVGRLMRDVDADHIRQQLEKVQAGTVKDVALLHRAERWRERLLADESALSEFVDMFPATDVQQLRTLLRNAKQELAAARPPRSFRALLRDIRQILLNQDRHAQSGAGNRERQ